jgi:hypothetical protein
MISLSLPPKPPHRGAVGGTVFPHTPYKAARALTPKLDVVMGRGVQLSSLISFMTP